MLRSLSHPRANVLPLAFVLTCLLGSSIIVALRYSPALFVANPKAEETNETFEKPGADEWFYEQRAYPLKEIPFGARLAALEQMDAAEIRQRASNVRLYGKAAAFAIEQQNQPAWEPLGPQPIANGNTGAVARPASGRATAIALHPAYDGVNNQTFWLGTAHGGVWKTTNNGVNWQPISDNEPSLAIGSIAVDPTNANVIYVGTGEGNGSGDSYYGAGLLKTTDGGAWWRVIDGPLASGNPRLPVFRGVGIIQITIDPRNPQTLYVCTRTASAYGPSGGGGTTGFAPGQRGLWKSTDGGETWRNLEPAGSGLVYSASELLIHPTNSNTVFAAVFGRGIYRSTQGGEPGTWEWLAGGLPQTTDVQRIKMTASAPLAPSTNPTLFAIVANASSALHGIYRSTDNGETWQTLNNPPSIAQTNYNLTLSADPQNPNILYCGMVSFYRSLDGGQTWQNQTNGDATNGVHVDQHASVVVPNKATHFFLANDGGVWRSENANDSTGAMRWINLNTNLNTVQFQGVAMHPLDPNYLLGGTQDNGTNRFTGDKAWTRVAGGDGGFALVDQSSPNIVWHSFQNSGGTSTTGGDFGPRLSLNAGNINTWTDRGCRNCAPVPGRMNRADRVGFYGPMTLHTGFTNPNNVIYWGTQRVYRSPDLGVTWTGLGPSTDGYGQDLSKGTGRASAIAAHPTLDTRADPPGEIVWVGTSDGNVQVTTNAGKLAEAVFTNVAKAPLPNRFVTEIAPDPANTRRAYVSFSGFNAGTPATPGHVFVTNDLGETWRDISGDLPDTPVLSIAIDTQRAGTLYIGTDIGVFQTTDEGNTWVRLGNGLPRVASFMVRLHAATRSLVVATHGRGMFRMKLPLATVSVSAASYSREALASEGIAAAFGSNLATRTESARTIPLPTSLAGTSVVITDANGVSHNAPLFFVSPQQVNYQIPPQVALGSCTVTITSGDAMTSFGIERIRSTAPAIFTFNGTGQGVPAGFGVRVRNGQQTSLPIAQLSGAQYVPLAIDLGPATDQVVLVLYGAGWRKRSALSNVRVIIGGVDIAAEYAGEAPGFVGLDQLNCFIPRALVGRGEIDVNVRLNGATSNNTRIKIN